MNWLAKSSLRVDLNKDLHKMREWVRYTPEVGAHTGLEIILKGNLETS